MPAVAQISVNFASRQQIVNDSPLGGEQTNYPSNITSVPPYALTQYLLFNREEIDNGIRDPKNLNYAGGFITADNRINVKHDTLQVLSGVDIENGLYTEFIHSRRKDTGDNYQNFLTSLVRSITLSPNPVDKTSNYIKIDTVPGSRIFSVYSNLGSAGTNSFIMNNNGIIKTIDLLTNTNNISADTVNIYGDVNMSKTLNVINATTLNNNLSVLGNINSGVGFNKFTVDNSGNIVTQGNLYAKGDLRVGITSFTEFSVAAATGNVESVGTLSIGGATSLGSTLGVTGATSLGSTLGVTGATTLDSTLGVTGATSLGSTLGVTGATSLGNTLSVTGATSLGSTLGVTGATTLDSTLGVAGATSLSSTLEVTGATTITGATILSSTLGVAGATSLAGSLGVAGATSLGSTLTVSDETSLDDNLNFTNISKELRRITNIRRINGPDDIFGPSSIYLNDPIAIGDFARNAFQRGMIILYSPPGGNLSRGSDFILTSPSGGWAVCDGRTVTFADQQTITPDLRERFVVGAGFTGNTVNTTNPVAGGGGYNSGDFGGFNTVTLASTEIPPHSHPNTANAASDITKNTGTHSHSESFVVGKGNTGRGQEGEGTGVVNNFNYGNIGVGGGHDHAVTTSVTMTNADNTGGGGAHENRPPYYALVYIIKL